MNTISNKKDEWEGEKSPDIAKNGDIPKGKNRSCGGCHYREVCYAYHIIKQTAVAIHSLNWVKLPYSPASLASK